MSRDDRDPEDGPDEPLHRLANLVGSILLSSQSILVACPLEEAVRRDLEEIEARCREAAELVSELRRSGGAE